MKLSKLWAYLTEAKAGKVVFTYGRFNPPTIGHLKLVEEVKKQAKKRNAEIHIYASKSQDPKKNPLKFATKVNWMRKVFKMKNEVIDSPLNNIFDILVYEYNKGTRNLSMVVGSDRVKEFAATINKYNGVEARHGFYNFEGGVEIISAGERDPDAEGVAGMSASKMRAAAADVNIQAFTSGLPSYFTADEVSELMYDVRDGMGV